MQVLLAQLAASRVEIWLAQGALRYRAPKQAMTAELLAELKANKQALIKHLKDLEQQPFPLTYGQRALWFLHQTAPESAAYNVAFSANIFSDINQTVFTEALTYLHNRHPALRFRFKDNAGQPEQFIVDSSEVDFDLIVAEGWSDEDLDAAVKLKYTQPFNLNDQQAPFRVRLFKRSQQAYLLLMVFHHIVGDGWSLWLILEELAQIYASLIQGQDPKLASSPAAYKKFALAQVARVKSGEVEQDWVYWRDKFSTPPALLNLPVKRPFPAQRSYQGKSAAIRIDNKKVARLKILAAEQGVTLYTLLLATYQLLLHRCSGQHQVCVGTPLAGRDDDAYSSVVGYFVNPLPLLSEVNAQSTVSDFIKASRQEVLSAMRHQGFPLPLVLERLPLDRDSSRPPLFQAAFVFQQLQKAQQLLDVNSSEQAGDKVVDWGGLKLAPHTLHQQEGQFDLSLELMEAGSDLIGSLKFNTDVFDLSDGQRLVDYYLNILDALPEYLDENIHDLPLLNADYQQQLLVDWNATQHSYPDSLVPSLLSEQAAKTPDNIALVFAQQSLTYAQLEQRSNRLAHYLTEQGVSTESLIAVCMQRSLELVISLHAIVKAGGAYIPLDPDYPQERLDYMIENSAAQYCLSQQNLSNKLNNFTGQRIVIETLESTLKQQPDHAPDNNLHPDNIAYIIYTSGSTGQPKGVANSHQALANRLNWMQRSYPLDQHDTVLQKTPYSFDVSVWEFFWPLMTGAKLIIAKPEGHKDSHYLAQLIQQQHINTLHFVPSMLQAFIEEPEAKKCTNLKRIICSGEALPNSLNKQINRVLPHSTLYNLYGPTEAAIDVSAWTCQSSDNHTSTVAIGKPIDNIQLYILDEQLQTVPIGVAGELYIAGIALARGYHHQAPLTAERFIPNPYGQGDRLYRTGDICKYREDGVIDYLGREDGQIKLRGFRIELGEIEAVLNQHRDIQQSVLIADSYHGTKALLAYITVHNKNYQQEKSEAELISQIREFLQSRLPEYMIPSGFMILPELPLSANGKIDRKALPAMTASATTEQRVAPETDSQQRIATIWQQLLKHEDFGIHTDFFLAGGHSLLVLRLISELDVEFGKRISIKDLFLNPTVARQSQLLEQSEQAEDNWPAITAQIEQKRPLSFSQQRLWFLNTLENAATVYHIPLGFHLHGQLNLEALNNALGQLLTRHPALRTKITTEGDLVEQQIVAVPPNNIQYYPTERVNKQGLETIAMAVVTETFDLSTGKVFRAAVLEIEPNHHLLLLVMHHIISDGWSVNILLSELTKFYQQELTQEVTLLPELPVQYTDYSRWQRQLSDDGWFSQAHDYWLKTLENVPTTLALIYDKSRPLLPSFKGAMEFVEIPAEIKTQLKNYAQQQGVTHFMLLISAFALVLYRYSGQKDFLIGTPVANRAKPELQNLIGFFVNTLLMRMQIEPERSFEQFLKTVKQIALEAYEYQYYPFEHLLDALQPERNLSVMPLFQVMFIYQEQAEQDFTLAGLDIEPMVMASVNSKCDLSLYVTEQDNKWLLGMEYSTDLFEQSSIKQLLNVMSTVLTELAVQPAMPLSLVPLLADDIESKIVTDWNATQHSYPDSLVPSLLSEQAAKTPDNIALVFAQQSLTYAQLEQRSNRLAHYLTEQGVSTESLIAVCMQRSLELVISLHAIVKAGGAYIPLDPDYPQERLDYMIENSAAQYCLSQQNLSNKLNNFTGQRIVIETLESTLKQQPDHAPDNNLHPDNIAYIIYTSGSTGQPKGVANSHQALANRLNWMQRSYPLDQHDTVLQKTPYSFDVSVWEFFWPLMTGAKLIIAKPEGHKDSHYLAQLIQQQHINTLHFVPSMLQAFIEEPEAKKCTNLKRIICSGEALPNSLNKQINRVLPHSTLYNLYGPTEAAIDVSAWTCQSSDNHTSTVAIGKPIDNIQLYILDEQLQTVPIGVAGELYIAGIALARGYHHQAPLTAERFIPNPYGQGDRLYRTGDICKYREDGVIDYLGREDGQIKLRGFRIELGEIEAVLNQHRDIQQSVLIADSYHGTKALLAYITVHNKNYQQEKSEAELISQIREFLQSRLPEYMIPSGFMILPELPLSANGKIDRKALPAMTASATTEQRVAPETDSQQRIATIWQQLLKHEDFGIHTDLFLAGGNSLLALRLISELAREFGQRIRVEDIFTFPTIAGQANILDADKRHQLQDEWPEVKVYKEARSALTFSQERLWFLNNLESAATIYHIPLIFRLRGVLNTEALQSAIADLVNRHHVLRSKISEQNNQLEQQLLTDINTTIKHYSADNVKAQSFEGIIEHEVLERFDLLVGRVFKTVLLEIEPQHNVLLLMMHHIISDGWSVNILLNDLSHLYQQHLSQEYSEKLPELSVQYTDYSRWQRQLSDGGWFESAHNYWLQALDNVPTTLALNYDKSRPQLPTFKGAMGFSEIPSALKSKLLAYGRQQAVTPYMLLLSVFSMVLYRYSGQKDFLIGTPIANRPKQKTHHLMGLFVNTVLMRIQIDPTQPFEQFLGTVRQTALSAYEYQYYPFERLLDALQPERDLAIMPLYQVMFDYQEQGRQNFELAGMDVQAVELSSISSKCDLTFNVIEQGDKWTLSIEYSTDLFEQESIKQLLTVITHALQELLEQPRKSLNRIVLLPPHNENKIRDQWNATEQDYSTTLLPELLSQQAAKTPDNIALVYEQQSLSYQALETRSNQLANYLRQQGVNQESLIAVCMQRSLELVISLHAIVKAGGAYIPLDPDYPQQRLDYMIQNSGAQYCLFQSALSDKLTDFTGQLINSEQIAQTVQQQSDKPPPLNLHPDNIVYILYTSGSTGLPKGVANSHGALANRLNWIQRRFPIGQNDVVLQKTPCSFDVSVWEFFEATITGAKLVIAKPNGHKDSHYLTQLIQQQKITTLHFVPAMLQVFIEEPEAINCTSLKRVFCGGEALPLNLQQQVQNTLSAQLLNQYGPTEAAIDISVWECQADDTQSSTIAIGTPIDNIQLYILDEQLQIVPIGVAGELYIAGIALARGYHNQAALTAERFIPNPFGQGGRIYRTGDICKYRNNGVIDYLGREDGQVKIRGFRIELGEIESILKQHIEIQDAIVKVWTQGKSKRLVAYLVARSNKNIEQDIKQHLQTLPDYMRPSQYVMLDSLPLTSSGKLDRRALQEPEIKSQQQYTAARNDVEQTLVDIWQTVLKLKQIGVTDNYFELGGDSILSIQVVSKAKQAGLELRIEDLFLGQTIEALAQSCSTTSQIKAEQGMVSGDMLLMPIQHEFFEKTQQDRHHFNQSVLLEVAASLDQLAIQKAVDCLLKHHDALRLQFKKQGEEKQIYIQSNYDLNAVFQCRTFASTDDLSAQLQSIQASFKQGKDLLIKVIYFTPEQSLMTGRLFIVIHHLAVDGVSWRIILEDLQHAYQLLVEQKTVSFPKKTTAFSEWSTRLKDWAYQLDDLKFDICYWQDYCHQSYLKLPLDSLVKEPVKLADTEIKTLHFDKSLSLALMQAPRFLSATVEEILLAALVSSLWQWQGKQNLVIELEGHGRENVFPDLDVSRTVGWFTTLFPLVISQSGDTELQAVKSAFSTLPNRGLSYGVLKYLSKDTDLQQQMAATETAGIRFNYLGRFQSAQADSALIGQASENRGQEWSAQQHFDLLMDVNCAVYEDCLQLDWRFSELQFNPETIDQLLAGFKEKLQNQLQSIVAELQSPFPLARMSDQRLQNIDNYSQLEDVYPLSPLQQGLLFHSVYARESSSYLQQVCWQFKGTLNTELWQQSWRQLIEIHPVLRTGFDWKGSEQPLQLVYKQVDLLWQTLNYSKVSTEKFDKVITDFIHDDRNNPFDTRKTPLIRFALLDFGSGHYFFVCTHHHLLLDGWSLPKLLEDVFKIYAAKLKGEVARLTTRKPFRDYIEWLSELDSLEQERFWQQKLKGFSATNKLSIDLGGEAHNQSAVFQQQTIILNEGLTQAIETFSRQQRVTINIITQAAWVILLSRYCNSKDIVFGLTVAGRPAALPDVENILGLFINTVPVRTLLTDEQTVSQLLKQLFKDHFERESYSHIQLAELQALSDIQGGQGLFDTLFIFENYPVDETLEQKTTTLSVEDFKVYEQTDLPLTLLIAPGKQLSITVSYQQQRFNESAIQALLGHFQHIMTAILLAENQRVEHVQLLSFAEQQELLLSNEKAVDKDCLTVATSLHKLIEQKVTRFADKVAVQFADQKLTYQQLNSQADQLAQHLLSQGIGRENIIAICLPRCLDMMVAVLAVLKTGAAYLPLDLKLPHKRLQFMLADSGAALLISKGAIGFDSPAPILDLAMWSANSGQPVSPVNIVVDANNLAYVIYTSGSTGQPKSVQVSHKNIINFITTMANKPGLTEHDRLLAVTTLAFDIAALELYLPLVAGATVVIADNQETADGYALKALLEQQKITAMQATPATWRLLLAADWQGSQQFKVLCGGEAFPVNLAEKLRQITAQVWNVYGPTETTVWSSCWQVDDSTYIKLGQPVANTRFYIVDENLKLVPANIPGELMIAGAGVARGYRNRAGLTAERFLPDLFTGSGERMYRTGDQVVRHLDGSIEYLGRLDFQAKIRGYRIELGEIESVMEAMPDIEQAVAVVLESSENQQLVAYYRGQTVDEKRIKDTLASQLPSYMIPSHFVQMQEFTLTHSDKVDRKALPKPQHSQLDTTSLSLPKSKLEQQLMAIWQAVLQREDFGVNDNFFDLGGHSLLLMQVNDLLQKQLDKPIQTVDLFHYPTIRKLVTHLEGDRANIADSVKRAEQKAQKQRSGRRKRTIKKG